MDTIAILDFGRTIHASHRQRIRRLGVYSEIVQCDIPASQCKRFKGIILRFAPQRARRPKARF